MALLIQSGGDGGDVRDRRDGGRNMLGLASEHGRPEGGNGTEANHDANGSDQADPQKSDKGGGDPVRHCETRLYDCRIVELVGSIFATPEATPNTRRMVASCPVIRAV